MRLIRPSTWEELLRELFADGWQPHLARHRLSCAFRGAPANEPLTPPLVRMGGRYWDVELPMLRAFRKYARSESRCDSVWEWMALAQHHGLPTRLLDWTHSPFVALHFATVIDDVPGVIWRADYRASNRRLPARLRRALRREGADMFTGEMLARVTDTLDGLADLSRRPFALFFEPPSLDARIVNQFALFSLLSDSRAPLERCLDELVRIEIDAPLVRQARDFLDQANVNERVLFPGLDGLTSYLARYYRPVSDGRIRGPRRSSQHAWMTPAGTTPSRRPHSSSSAPRTAAAKESRSRRRRSRTSER